MGFAIGGMMPTLVSVLAGTPADLPIVLAVCLAAVSVLYLIGAFVIPETRGNLTHDT
jgi:hypothetical protein